MFPVFLEIIPYLYVKISNYLCIFIGERREEEQNAEIREKKESTPKKKRLIKQLATYRKRNSRLKKRIDFLRRSSRSGAKKNDNLNIAKSVLQEYLSGPALDLVLAQLTPGKKTGKRWSQNMKLYCLSIYYKSPSTYRFLKKTFSIPSVRTLQRLFNKGQVTPGFSSSLFKVIEHRVKKMNYKDTFCNLLLDEMSIKEGLSFCSATDKILGFEDYGNFGTGKNLGKQALVFMATGLFSHWKQPLAYIISKSATSAKIMIGLIEECIVCSKLDLMLKL